MVGKLLKNGDIRPVNKKDIFEKPLGVAPTPLCRRGYNSRGVHFVVRGQL